MQRSTDRILTTHTGSLPRPEGLLELLEAHDQREVRSGPDFDAQVAAAVDEIVRKQAAAGISVVNDGEMSKVGYATYVTERLTGFDGESRVAPPLVEAGQFPEYFQSWSMGAAIKRPVCTGPIAWRGTALVQQDLANLKAAVQFTDKSIADFRTFAERHVDALNHALGDLPADRVRLHLCWGNYEGPHTRDIALGQIFDIVLKAQAQAFSFEGANPRHEHEWKLFRDLKLPEGTILIPGILDSTTNFVEHPELVAERIIRYAQLVGRANVIAGADCGFSTFARSALTVHPTVTWAKFQALAEGAKLASQQLWG